MKQSHFFSIKNPLASLALWVIGCVGCLPGEGWSLENVIRETYSGSNQTQVRVDAVFPAGFKNGFVPYIIRIQNNTTVDRVWKIRFQEEGYRSLNYTTYYEIPVESGSESVSEVVVPMAPSFSNNSGYRGFRIFVTCSGFPKVERMHTDNSDDSWPSIGISKKLAQRSLTKLNDAREKASSGSGDRFGFTYEAENLPSDWRGYTCLDALMIDEQAWKELHAAQLQAIREWVRMGGQLDIYSSKKMQITETGLPQLEIQPGRKGEGRLSFGKVMIRDWDGRELQSSVAYQYRNTEAYDDSLSEDFDRSWDLGNEFGTKDFNSALVFILLIAFAIVVAPVNLFYFAKEGKRQRMFITTPIISLAACIIIMGIIYLKDGVGGEGLRLALVDLQTQDGENSLYVSQEQVSRTGVMLRSGFDSEAPIDISPVQLPPSSWNPLSKQNARLGTLNFAGNQLRGDFFRSRSEQGFSLRAVQPTRSRIELRKEPLLNEDAFSPEQDTPPELFSSMSFSIQDFFYRDNYGRVWKSPEGAQIDPGNPIPLESSSSTELVNWVGKRAQIFSNKRSSSIRKLNSSKNRFFASVVKADELLLPTSSAIRWKNDRVLLTGSVPSKATAASTKSPEGTPKPEGSEL